MPPPPLSPAPPAPAPESLGAAYRRRASTKSKVLLRFFGDTPPLDVSIEEVRAEGFKAILHSKLPLCYYLVALLEDYASENLFFILEVERYEASPFPDAHSHLQAAYAVFETYLGRGSQLEVNVDDRVRRAVIGDLARLGRAWVAIDSTRQRPQQQTSSLALSPASAPSSPSLLPSPVPPPYLSPDALPPSAIAAGLRHLFDPAKAAVLALLETSYAKFARSPLYARMVSELERATVPAMPHFGDLGASGGNGGGGGSSGGGGGGMYTGEAKQAALLVLCEYMHRHGLLSSELDLVTASGGNPARARSRSPSPAAPPRSTSRAGAQMAGRSPGSPSPVEVHGSAFAATGGGGLVGAVHDPPLHMMTHADPDARRALARRMLQGFAITMLGVDLVEHARERGMGS